MKTNVQVTREMELLLFKHFSLKLPRQSIIGVVFALIIALFSFNASAQNIQEYGALIASMGASSDPGIRKQAAHLDSLVVQIQPKIHLKNSTLRITGETPPVCLDLDVESVGMLGVPDLVFKKVELITIRINSPDDLNFSLKQATLKSFENLRYVLFLVSYPCDPQQLSGLFFDNKPGITVFYNISIPN